MKSEDLRRRLETLCRRYGVASLYVFGSRAREVATRVDGAEPVLELPLSDVDLAVHPRRGALQKAFERGGLQAELEELLGVDRADLVILPEVSAFLAADAVRGELLYCDDEDRQALEELYYLRRAADLAPYQRERLEALLEGELHR
jgi:uncharacterized protein